jgi:hypothetical protein
MRPIKYGHRWLEGDDDLAIELGAFRRKLSVEDGGLGRLGHYQELLKMLYPKLVYNDWTYRMHEAFCRDEEEVILTGPASAGKSWEVARFAIIWMLASPMGDCAIPVTSTSVQMSRKRIWAKLKTMAIDANAACKKRFGYELPFHILDSSTEIQIRKGDSEHAIAIVPGSQKFAQDGVTKLKGWHAKYVLILADELQDMTDEVIQSCANMRSGTREFKFIGSGNGCSWLNTMGKLIMPASGNPESVNVDMDEWKTKTGVCIHFDGLKSPNVIEPGKYPYLQSQDQIDKTVNQHGEDSLQYWQMVRGFPPPDDSFNAIISESLLLKFSAMKQQVLAPGYEEYGALDPGYGGDGCVLKTAKVGTFILSEGEMPRIGVVFGEKLEIKTISSKSEPIDFQIAEQAIAFCKSRGIKPQNFSVDCTGTGRGVAAIIRKQWSNEINCVEYGASASDMPVSGQDMTKCKDAYWNRVTELYYSFRTFTMNNQVRGVTPQMARAFGCRTYTVKNGRSLLAPKLEARKVLGRSPDEEDASVMIVDCMRRQGFFAGPMGFGAHWTDAVREAAALEESCDYAPSDPILTCPMV